MSLKPSLVPDVPEQTARVARAASPKGNPYHRPRDALGPVFRDADFADLHPGRGQPALPPGKLALVTVMQSAEDLPSAATGIACWRPSGATRRRPGCGRSPPSRSSAGSD